MLCVNTFAATTNTKTNETTIICDKAACDSVHTSANTNNYHLKEFVKTLGTIGIGSSDAVLYSKPSTKSKQIAVIPSHRLLPIRSINYDLWWCRVQCGKKTGYLPLCSVDPAFLNKGFTADIHDVPDDKAERIRSIIVWDDNYNKNIENMIIYEMNKVPEPIFRSFFNVAYKSIHVVPSLAYRDKDGLNVIAYIDYEGCANRIERADIYLEKDLGEIAASLLHEVGHFADAAYQYAGGDMSLRGFSKYGTAFANNERYGNMYYANFLQEYTAELFRFTIDNGTSKKYPDTYKMQAAIDLFGALQTTNYSVPQLIGEPYQ